jgi:TonB family protein
MLGCTMSAQSNSYPQHLANSLEKHAVVMRHYYTDSKLQFDSTAQLISKGTEGFGPTDGRIYVTEVRLTADKLVLNGTRLINVYNAAQETWEAADMGRKVSVEVALPTGAAPEAVVPHLLNGIFLKQSEMTSLQCSAQERLDFQNDVAQRLSKNIRFEPPKLPDAQTLDELHPYCFPGGERAYKVVRGIKAPHAKHTPDPNYSEAARKAKLHGTTVLLLVISPEGLPSAISVVRSLGVGLDTKNRPLGQQLVWKAVEAVSKWKFEPARFGNVPVPVVINVEVNFRLY